MIRVRFSRGDGAERLSGPPLPAPSPGDSHSPSCLPTIFHRWHGARLFNRNHSEAKLPCLEYPAQPAFVKLLVGGREIDKA